MTDRQQEEAAKWADSILQSHTGQKNFPPAALTAARYILGLEEPAPTMTDVEWDNDTHWLMEAEHDKHGKVIMTGSDSPWIRCVFPGETQDQYIFHSRDLTPTGRKYKLLPNEESGGDFPEGFRLAEHGVLGGALPKGFRLADHKKHGRVIVSLEADEEGDHEIFCANNGDSWHYWPYAEDDELTFLDSEPLQKLITKQDFEDAPVGTVVKQASEALILAVKDHVSRWSVSGTGIFQTHLEMADFGPWAVLEWGTK